MIVHPPAETRAQPTATISPIPVLAVIAGFAFVIFQVLFAIFFVFYRIADAWAVDRSEAHGFDPGQLLPHDGIMWLAATGAALLLFLIDVVLIVMVVLWFAARRRAGRAPR